jgi:hypothetical protein
VPWREEEGFEIASWSKRECKDLSFGACGVVGMLARFSLRILGRQCYERKVELQMQAVGHAADEDAQPEGAEWNEGQARAERWYMGAFSACLQYS